ncbi:hypothetical protein [Sphingomonas sp. AX6]|uniref:hypothetical protein n=1 Tax=Sphingomonas sp. AX6 TaxID=2653171 RepID=UPI0012F46578|nr:hypothetical protein [Sphingomonas sp. AX6]VXC63330.1 conserved hypothetical protein [Sphingomonas sp. AX6]
MKEVTLKSFAVIRGAVRYASEGPITVTEDEAKRLKDADQLADDDDDDDGDDLTGLKLVDLKKVAEDEGVDLGEATTKAAIADLIRAHRATAPGE